MFLPKPMMTQNSKNFIYLTYSMLTLIIKFKWLHA